MSTLHQYDWILALVTIAFCASSFGNGANDVANSYATSVAARTLTMPQVGFLSIATEFVGAVALGSRVTGTIRSRIIDIRRFRASPSVLLLAMACAEFGSALWLIVATKAGFPVSTTQTVVGALVGVGIASGAPVQWAWRRGSVSQIAASWAVSPLLSAAFSAILFGTLKYGVLERENPLEKGLKAIPWYLAFTGGVLALFITVEAPGLGELEELGAGRAVGIVLGSFFGCLAVAYLFFAPYFHRRLVRGDTRVRVWHVVLGPLLWREEVWLFWPGKELDGEGGVVKDYYRSAHVEGLDEDTGSEARSDPEKKGGERAAGDGGVLVSAAEADAGAQQVSSNGDAPPAVGGGGGVRIVRKQAKHLEPEDRFLAPNRHLPLWHPRRLWGFVKYFFLQGITRDCVTHSSQALADVHARARRYDNRVEHLWTYAQVASAMMMSIAHGSNDVANAVGPWVSAYGVWRDGAVTDEVDTPVWILAVAGFLLGAGFWFFGYHIMRSLGNRITQLSPTRGFSMELGAAITVLLASRLGLPVSTTQCLTGAVFGVALMNYDLGAVNWRQMAFIFTGWVLTLPTAGLVSGLLMAMSLNTPHFM